MAHTTDDEWEYEYDENETEDFYVPLDLINVPAAQIPIVSQGRPGHPTLLKTRLRALNAAQGQSMVVPMGTAEDQETGTMGELQIIGLHTTNPLVMYNGQLLSCHWGSTIGTDMFFVKPGSLTDGTSGPLRSLPSVDLLSLGSAKLAAKVGRLWPRDDLFDDDEMQTTEPSVSTSSQVVNETGSEDVPVEDQLTAANVQPAPNSFLAKLNLAKAKRGDKTQLVASKTSDGTHIVARKTEDALSQGNPQSDTAMSGL